MNFAPFFEFFDRSVSVQLTYALWHFLWQGVVIAGLLFGAIALLQKTSPRLRYALAVAAMLAMVGCLPANYLWLRATMGTPDDVLANSSVQFVETIDMTTPPASVALKDSIDVIGPIAASPRSSLIEDWAPLAAAGYTAGVLLMTLRLVCSTLAVFRLRAVSIRVTDSRLITNLGQLCTEIGLRVQPALMTCDKLTVPVVIGLLKPVILVPPSIATGMTCDELEAILLHELAHIRRSDLLVNFLQRVAESFLFFHPAVWYVSRLIACEREDCCDDVVLSKCNRHDYARALIRLAESCTGQSPEMAPVAALAATGGRPSQLKRRVTRILGAARPPRHDKPGAGLVITFAVALSIATFNLHAQTEQSDGNVDARENTPSSEGPASAERVGETTKLPSEGNAPFVGPVQMEQVGDVLLIRGVREDVKKAQQMIAAIVSESHPKSPSINTEGKRFHGPAQIERNDVGQLVIRGESEQDIEALEQVLREVWIDLLGAPQPKTAQQTLRSLQLSEGAKPEMLEVALDAYLEGRGIDDAEVRYQITTDEAKAKLIVCCQDVHFQQLLAFLQKRKWITDTESDGERYWVYHLKYVAAEAAEELLKTLFLGAEADLQFTADERLNTILVRASKSLAPKIEAVLKHIDTRPENQEAVKAIPNPPSFDLPRDSSSTSDGPPRSVAQRLRLSFKQTPWPDVLNWIAEHTKSSINQDRVPGGTFSFEDRSRSYSPAEAFDVINEALYRKGDSLVRGNKMIHIVDLDDATDSKLARDILAETPLAKLNTRGAAVRPNITYRAV